MIKTTIDTTDMERYPLENYNRCVELAKELEAVGYNNLEIVKGSEWCDYNLLLTVEEATFNVWRQHKGRLTLSLEPYSYYSNVSSSKRGEVYKATFTSNAVKVITKKKVDNMTAEELRYHEQMATLNNESLDKIQSYLAKIKQLENEYAVSYCRRDYNGKREIMGGTITCNGIQFTFEIDYTSGYINEKVTLEYSYNENKIDMFKLLADNKYITNK